MYPLFSLAANELRYYKFLCCETQVAKVSGTATTSAARWIQFRTKPLTHVAYHLLASRTTETFEHETSGVLHRDIIPVIVTSIKMPTTVCRTSTVIKR